MLSGSKIKRYLPDYMYPRSARYDITFFILPYYCTYMYARYPEEKCVPPQPLGEYLALSSETYRKELLGNDVCALYHTYLPTSLSDR